MPAPSELPAGMVVTILVAACDSKEIVDLPVSLSRQETFDINLGGRSPVVFVLVVDDAADCYPKCHTDPISVAPDGTIPCRVFVDQTDLERCDPERGHRDPDGKPELSRAQYCEQEHAWPVRFTGESIGAPGDWLHVVCNVTSTEG